MCFMRVVFNDFDMCSYLYSKFIHVDLLSISIYNKLISYYNTILSTYLLLVSQTINRLIHEDNTVEIS